MLVNYPPIDRLLGQLATTHQCDILMAVESGSRCWGFDSPDSDFDVRGITVHLNQDRYLSLFTRPHDVDISTTVTVGGEVIDVVLWDLGKALRLCWKSNPSLIDWLQSPLDYRPRDPRLTRVLEEDQGIWYDRFSHAMHFFSMARKNTREFLQGD
ncbi:MAG TPA: nucleotidyltransferase domain-containing protein, partial [bacterium]|nr:nucleotidyltransferase domain-containing protein [bacterium]